MPASAHSCFGLPSGPPRLPDPPDRLRAPGGLQDGPVERPDPSVLDYLRAEEAWFRRWCAEHTAGLPDALFDEIRALVDEEDASAPVAWGPWEYWTETRTGQAYPIHCRRRRSEPVGFEVVLDENALCRQLGVEASSFALFDLAISPDQRWLACSVDTTGTEVLSVHFRDLAALGHDEVGTGTWLDDVLSPTSFGLEWSADGEHLWYLRADRTQRPAELWLHRRGTDSAQDRRILSEPDERFHLSLGRTHDRRWVLLAATSKLTSETWLLDPLRPSSPPRSATGRTPGVLVQIEHHQGRLLALTNHRAKEGRLLRAPCEPGTPFDFDHADELVEERPGVSLEAVLPFAHRLLLQGRFDGHLGLELVDLDGGSRRRILRAGHPGALWAGVSLDWQSPTARVLWTSLAEPREELDLDLATGTLRHLRQVRVPGWQPDEVEAIRIEVSARDGVPIPVDLVRPLRPHRLDSPPLLLVGYGAYGASLEPAFSVLRVPLLRRGWTIALAHVRGGGELGQRWHEAGRLERKATSFSDFVDVARHLTKAGFVAPGRMAWRGASAGGLLVAASANLDPTLPAAIVAEVPFVDCLTTMSDPSLPLTVTEWEEWGNPIADREAEARIRSWSPVDNVRRCRYPAVLATAGLHDSRVGYHEPAKWVQALRDADPENLALLHVDFNGGHLGPADRYAAWREEALASAFLLTVLA